MKTELFFDTEFTGLHQKTTLISIGIISECGKTFYAELNDYDKSQLNDWLRENVIKHLGKTKDNSGIKNRNENCVSIGNAEYVRHDLLNWLTQFEEIEIWSDVLAYDWMLFNMFLADFSNGYPQLPKNIYYIPFDLATLFKIKGIDPDINREEFAHIENMILPNGKCPEKLKDIPKHNALWDAIIIKECYNNLLQFS